MVNKKPEITSKASPHKEVTDHRCYQADFGTILAYAFIERDRKSCSNGG